MRDWVKIPIYVMLVILFLLYTASVYFFSAPETPISHSVIDGKMVWQQKNCNACHQIYGLGGFLGPDLTNIYSAQGKSPDYIKAFIQNGTATMPAFDLTEVEYTSLFAFLQNVDASGKSSPKIYNTNWNGTIERK